MLEGQDNLYKKFDELSLVELPHSIMLLGDVGCGKHTFSEYIADKFNLEYIDITQAISGELLDELQIRNVPTLYVIDISKFTDKQQFTLLKFLEDYNEFIYTCVINNNSPKVLPTIMNRCIKYRFDALTSDILSKYALKYFSGNDVNYALNICNTIGQIKGAQGQDFAGMKQLCESIITKMKIANLANTLSLSNKFNYKDTYDKFDVKLFFNMMLYTINSLFKENKLNIDYKDLLKYYKVVQDYRNKLFDERLSKQHIIESFLLDFWKLVR